MPPAQQHGERLGRALGKQAGRQESRGEDEGGKRGKEKGDGDRLGMDGGICVWNLPALRSGTGAQAQLSAVGERWGCDSPRKEPYLLARQGFGPPRPARLGSEDGQEQAEQQASCPGELGSQPEHGGLRALPALPAPPVLSSEPGSL